MGISGLLRALGPLLVAPDGDPANGGNNDVAAARSNAPLRSSPKRGRSVGSSGGGGSRSGTHNIRQFTGRRIAVDVSSWLHRGAYSCCSELVESLESQSSLPDSSQIGTPRCATMYARYVLNRCDELLNHAGLARIDLVFDGRRCPLKAGTNEERERRKADALREARRLKREGRTREAEEKYKMCVRVTRGMERRVAEAVMQKWGRGRPAGGIGSESSKVTCVFSPYEADAQMAKLCRDGVVDAVITEDSDVLVYSAAIGVPFPIIYKLDRDTGECDVLTMDWLLSPVPSKRASNDPLSDLRRYLPDRYAQNGKKKGSPSKGDRSGSFLSSLRAFSRREILRPGSGVRLFVQACVLSGCDYAPSRLSGIGHVNAFRLVVENAHRKDGERYLRLLRSLPRGTVIAGGAGEAVAEKGKTKVGDEGSPRPAASAGGNNEAVTDYEDLLMKSEAVFYYHRVLDVSSDSVVGLSPDPEPTETEAEPPSSSTSSRKDKTPGQYLPCGRRFEHDLSFVGEFCAAHEPLPSEGPVPSNGPLASCFANQKSGTSPTAGDATRSGGRRRDGSTALFQRERDSAVSSIARMVSERAGAAAHETWSSSSSSSTSSSSQKRGGGRTPSSSLSSVMQMEGATLRKPRRANPFAQFSRRGVGGAERSSSGPRTNIWGTESSSADDGRGKAEADDDRRRTHCVSPVSALSARRVTAEAGGAAQVRKRCSDEDAFSAVGAGVGDDATTGEKDTSTGDSSSDEDIAETAAGCASLPPSEEESSTSRFFSTSSGRFMSRKVSLESGGRASMAREGGAATATAKEGTSRSSKEGCEQTATQQQHPSNDASSPDAAQEESSRPTNAPNDLCGSSSHEAEAEVSSPQGSKDQPVVLDSDDDDDEHINDRAAVRTDLPRQQHQQDRLARIVATTTAAPEERPSSRDEHYISPFQSRQQAIRRVTPRASGAKKSKSMQRMASPLMAGFARQRSLSSSVRSSGSETLPPAWREEASTKSTRPPPAAAFTFGADARPDRAAPAGGAPKKRKHSVLGTINKFFQPLSTKRRHF